MLLCVPNSDDQVVLLGLLTHRLLSAILQSMRNSCLHTYDSVASGEDAIHLLLGKSVLASSCFWISSDWNCLYPCSCSFHQEHFKHVLTQSELLKYVPGLHGMWVSSIKGWCVCLLSWQAPFFTCLYGYGCPVPSKVRWWQPLIWVGLIEGLWSVEPRDANLFLDI